LKESNKLQNLKVSFDIGYYRTTKELFRTLLFNVLYETGQQDLVLQANVGLWPNYLRAVFLLSPVLENDLM